MNSDRDSSHREVGAEGRVQVLDSDRKDLRDWFQEYTAMDPSDLVSDSDEVLVVNFDKLDMDFIEQRIRESAPKSPLINGFCASCQDLFDNWPLLGDSSTMEHDEKNVPKPGLERDNCTTVRLCSTFELEGSARLGCRFCNLLLQNLKDCNLLDTFRKIEARLWQLDDNAISSLSIQNLQIDDHRLWLNLPGKVCSRWHEGIGATVHVDLHSFPASVDCYDDPLDVFDIAKGWLSTCSESHELCKSVENSILPTRLISISGEWPRLVLSSGCPSGTRYATLSHSWGLCDVIKLKSTNLEALMKIIPFKMLPKTFKDAIDITQRLGLDYLWIDSLCIIQDSEGDWQREAALMSAVYGGTAINIAASSARDSTHGCFLKPPYFNGGFRARTTTCGRQRVQEFQSPSTYRLSTIETHLGTRAWTLQEKLLSPKTIHFGDRGAFWECREMIASEFLPGGVSDIGDHPLVFGKWHPKWRWHGIVSLYSAANLTFGKDKLIALSGIARLIYNETGDQYLAGLWRAQIVEQLCWSFLDSKPRVKRPLWRAPTWSWASVDGRVSWEVLDKGLLETKYVHVLDANTRKYDHDPFGQVTNGIISLACSIMTAGHLAHSHSSSEPEAKERAVIVLDTSNEKKEFPVQIDCLDDSSHEDDRQIYLLPLLGGRTGVTFTILPDDEDREGLAEQAEKNEVTIRGIVLSATSVTKGEFSRIGSFSFYKDSLFYNGDRREGDYEAFLQTLLEHGSSTAKAASARVVVDSEHPDEQYVITLI